MTKYTFLLPAYKAAFFKEALQSIKGQTYTDFKVLVSDDCSPEPLKPVFDEVCGSDPRFTYRRNETNMGSKSLVSHWNLLVDMCDTDFLVMASDDDVYHPRFLEEIDRLQCKYPKADLLRARVRHIDREGRVIIEESNNKEYVNQLQFWEQFFCKPYGFCIANLIFRTEALKVSKHFMDFPLAMSSDDAAVIDMSVNGVVNENEAPLDFRMSGINISYPKEDESYQIVLQKRDAANLFCVWMNERCREKECTISDFVQWRKIKDGIGFYLFCCTSNILYRLGFREALKEYRFMSKLNLFPNRKTQIKVFFKWWKHQLVK